MANNINAVANYCSINDGQLIHINGRSYHAVLREDRPTLGLTATDLDGKRRKIQVPLAKKPPCPLPETWGYWKITELVEGAEVAIATLKSWEDEGDPKTKTFRIACKETTKDISVALEKEYHEVFCTIIKIMGKEVLGDIKCLPKDAPILRMPDLVMQKIFSNLREGDLLNCRLVTETWAFDLIPITYLRACRSLEIGIGVWEGEGADLKSIRATLSPLGEDPFDDWGIDDWGVDDWGGDDWGVDDWGGDDWDHPITLTYDRPFTSAHSKAVTSRPVFPNLHDLKAAGLLHNVGFLTFYGPPSDPDDYEIICELHNLSDIAIKMPFSFRHHYYMQRCRIGIEEEFGEVWDLLIDREIEASVSAVAPKPPLWTLFADVIRNNKDSLQTIEIYDREVLLEKNDQMDLEVLKDCSNLKRLVFKTVGIGERTFMKNIEALPSSLTSLVLKNLKNPLKKQQVQWITQNLTNLWEITIDIHQSYKEAEDVDDVDRVTVTNLLTIPSLHKAMLFFGDYNVRSRIVGNKMRELIQFFETAWENGNWAYQRSFMGNVLNFRREETWEDVAMV